MNVSCVYTFLAKGLVVLHNTFYVVYLVISFYNLLTVLYSVRTIAKEKTFAEQFVNVWRPLNTLSACTHIHVVKYTAFCEKRLCL